MARFLARRTLQGLIVIWLVTVIVFLIFYVGPGSADVAGRSRVGPRHPKRWH